MFRLNPQHKMHSCSARPQRTRAYSYDVDRDDRKYTRNKTCNGRASRLHAGESIASKQTEYHASTWPHAASAPEFCLDFLHRALGSLKIHFGVELFRN